MSFRVGQAVTFCFIGLLLGAGAGLLRRGWWSRESSISQKAAISAKSANVSAFDCTKSLQESDGFYCEHDSVWEARIDVLRRRAPRQCGDEQFCCNPALLNARIRSWYPQCFEPEWPCLIERLGRIGDGGKYVCNVEQMRQNARDSNRPCLIYSLGSNGDYSFEQAVHARMPECEIFTFDPTVNQTRSPPPPYIKFLPWGITGSDNIDPALIFGARAMEGAKMYKLRTIMRLLGHTDREIDIFKIDIEGSEYKVFDDLYADDLFPFRQILIELHVPARSGPLHAFLRRHGYAITHREPNYAQHLQLHEYSFLRLSRAIFRDRVLEDPVTALITSNITAS
mmetsp:Transcript_6186/g.16490  ORF Transcript_6186/g.16490 Transcript_6186/m.16490 type:complete len:339 (-) Transcript_6186:24-1040(-)